MSNHILMVADEQSQLWHIQSELQSYGLTVNVVNNSSAGLSTHNWKYADVIVLNVNQVETNDYRLCRIFKSNPATAHIPLILVSHRDESSAVLAAFHAGVQDYIIQDIFTTHNLVESLRCLNVL